MIAGLICLKWSLVMEEELFFKNIFTSSLAEKQTFVEKYIQLLSMLHIPAFNFEGKYRILEEHRALQPQKKPAIYLYSFLLKLV